MVHVLVMVCVAALIVYVFRLLLVLGPRLRPLFPPLLLSRGSSHLHSLPVHPPVLAFQSHRRATRCNPWSHLSRCCVWAFRHSSHLDSFLHPRHGCARSPHPCPGWVWGGCRHAGNFAGRWCPSGRGHRIHLDLFQHPRRWSARSPLPCPLRVWVRGRHAGIMSVVVLPRLTIRGSSKQG